MAWNSRLRALFRRKKLAQELDEELEFHLSMRQQWNADRGMAAATARRDARLRFGNPAPWRERMSEIDLVTLPQTVLQDLPWSANPHAQRGLHHRCGVRASAGHRREHGYVYRLQGVLRARPGCTRSGAEGEHGAGCAVRRDSRLG
jgi:hypothetical protein